MNDDDSLEASDDALTLLAADHEEVRDLFAEFEDLVADGAPDEERLTLAMEICELLSAHATAEEEIFYPAVRSVLGDEELVDEAESEHASARALIEQIQGMEASDDGFDAAVRVLAEAVEHHVQEEEGELFPRVRDSGLDLDELGERIAARREELLAELDDDAA